MGKTQRMWNYVKMKKYVDYLEINNDVCIAEHPNDANILCVKKIMQVIEDDDEENEEEGECLIKRLHDVVIKVFKTIRQHKNIFFANYT